MVFPNPVDTNVPETGVCIVKAWPPLITSDEMDVFTDGDCAITKGSIKNIDMYITAIFFTLDDINSFCLQVNCWTQLDVKTARIITSKCWPMCSNVRSYVQLNASLFVDPTTDTISTNATEPITVEPDATSDSEARDEPTTATTSGVLGIYRITLWIIVLTLTIFSTAMTSLTSGFFL